MNLIAVGILACEIGFWIMLAGGLAVRYLCRAPRASTLLLLCVPLLDVLLLALICGDLLAGGTADWAHGLGALYLGITVVFGHSIVSRVDAWAAHRLADGPPPAKRPSRGRGRVGYEWREWSRMLLVLAIAAAVVLGIQLIVGDEARTGALWGGVELALKVTVIWLLISPVWETVRYLAAPGRADAEARVEAERHRLVLRDWAARG
ncbi:hypothetical protein [Mycetocola spongiae]|uniref:hypothetical protein n=1 Tax=Mycetocola spongiae TaxID=2859226 RepID=UPI001CF33DEE|nr:hypothetical protein [Mycetocola spongiae]UCR90097.1 hypothetical protein KXZ72_05375 [Mycetocola spongiae]